MSTVVTSNEKDQKLGIWTFKFEKVGVIRFCPPRVFPAVCRPIAIVFHTLVDPTAPYEKQSKDLRFPLRVWGQTPKSKILFSGQQRSKNRHFLTDRVDIRLDCTERQYAKIVFTDFPYLSPNSKFCPLCIIHAPSNCSATAVDIRTNASQNVAP